MAAPESSRPNPADLFEPALSAHRRGDFEAARAGYLALLSVEPEHVDALHMLGMLEHQQGSAESARDWLDRALIVAPGQPAILANRATVRLAAADLAGAERDAREATQRDPQNFGAWFNLGLALRGLARFGAAATAFARASSLRAQHARALLEWFHAAALSGRGPGLPARVRQPLPALAAERDFALQVATALESHGFAGPAFAVLARLRSELPGDAEIIRRHNIEARYGAAALLEHRQQPGAALAAASALLELAPQHRGARLLRASLLGERGEASLALAEYRRLIDIVPDDAVAGSAYLIALQHDEACSADAVAAAHREWAARHLPALPPRRPLSSSARDPERPLRVGWLSPRFFSGLVANFFLAALARFERGGMQHILYDSSGVEDAVSAQFRRAAQAFHRVDELDDEMLCERIRDDKIDVLVELSGHSPGNRLRALAARPAPVQVTWLDYFHSTGTAAIDVIFSDEVLSPPSLERHYTEQVVRLPSGRLCYTPPHDAPEVTDRPTGPIRFASFNRVNKLNDEVLAAWARVLAAVPGSTLRLKARAFGIPSECDHFLERCAQHGIAKDCLELLGYGTHAQALAGYADVDIALDPFPFSGCATSLDALWMGVPVITRLGETMVGRQTASLLTSLELPDLIADNIEHYVERAVALAADLQRRSGLRRALRAKMAARLCDADRHARELQAALRECWRRRCEGG